MDCKPIETAPRDGTEIIGAWRCLNGSWEMNKVHYHDGLWWVHYMDGTHDPEMWQPLPDAHLK